MERWESNVIRPDFGAGLRNSDALLGDRVHSLLDTLAKMDLEYEEKRSMIARSACDLAFKERILRKFRERHRARREPFLAQLAHLQGCAWVLDPVV